MKLTFVGAAHEVTGSCHFLQVAGKNVLVDCGMEQGPDLYENPGLPISATEVDYVFLTHAHIDHSGMLPKLAKDGFKGQIFTTYATADLCGIMLRDSAHIQEFEAEWRNRKGRRAGKPEYEPVYEMQDALNAIELLVPCQYGERITICEGIQIRFTDVGHLLGSASIEVWATEDGVTKKIVFSGDIGNLDQPIIKDPAYTESADYIVMESTYGNRLHTQEKPDYLGDFTRILKETFDKGGNVVIPSFAVGRTQELLYFIREIKEKELLKEYQNFEVYLDSPLAIEATKIFTKNMRECFDEDALALVNAGINPLIFDGLKTATTSDDSKMINFIEKPKVIISASGMCDAGRIRHHLKHNLWREECTILFVGYQAMGTLGRRLIEGEKNVKLFGEPIEVKARIESLHGISGHADMNGLLKWLGAFKEAPQRVFVVHGEDTVTEEFAKTVEEKFGYQAYAPFPCSEADLLTNEILSEGKSKSQMKLMGSGHTAAVARATSYFSDTSYYNDMTGGIGYFKFLEDCAKNFDEKKSEIIAGLKRVMEALFTRENMTVSYTADDEGFSYLGNAMKKLSEKLPAGSGKIYPFTAPKENLNEGFTSSSKVNYVAHCGTFAGSGYSYTGALRILKVMLSYDYLWINIRVKGGAYGCMSGIGRSGEGYFVSYRDPEVKKSDDIYLGIPAYLENFEADERTMTKYVIGTISDIDTPLTPSLQGSRGLSAWYSGVTDEMLKKEREEILNATVEDIRALAPITKAILETGAVCVVGNEDKIKADSEIFKEIKPLFA